MVVARLVARFEISLGESHDEARFWSGWKDYLVVEMGTLWLRFKKRE